MPYINQSRRHDLNSSVGAKSRDEDLNLLGKICEDAGELNYLFTMIAKGYLEKHGERYQRYNDLIGALEGAKLELYARKTRPYEEKKMIDNGDVF